MSKPYAVGEGGSRSWMGRDIAEAPLLTGSAAAASLGPYLRTRHVDSTVPPSTALWPKQAFAEFPVQAGFLAACRAAGYDARRTRLAIVKAASLGESARRQWNDFFAKLAADSAAKGGAVHVKRATGFGQQSRPAAGPPATAGQTGMTGAVNRPAGGSQQITADSALGYLGNAGRAGGEFLEGALHGAAGGVGGVVGAAGAGAARLAGAPNTATGFNEFRNQSFGQAGAGLTAMGQTTGIIPPGAGPRNALHARGEQNVANLKAMGRPESAAITNVGNWMGWGGTQGLGMLAGPGEAGAAVRGAAPLRTAARGAEIAGQVGTAGTLPSVSSGVNTMAGNMTNSLLGAAGQRGATTPTAAPAAATPATGGAATMAAKAPAPAPTGMSMAGGTTGGGVSRGSSSGATSKGAAVAKRADAGLPEVGNIGSYPLGHTGPGPAPIPPPEPTAVDRAAAALDRPVGVGPYRASPRDIYSHIGQGFRGGGRAVEGTLGALGGGLATVGGLAGQGAAALSGSPWGKDVSEALTREGVGRTNASLKSLGQIATGAAADPTQNALYQQYAQDLANLDQMGRPLSRDLTNLGQWGGTVGTQAFSNLTVPWVPSPKGIGQAVAKGRPGTFPGLAKAKPAPASLPASATPSTVTHVPRTVSRLGSGEALNRRELAGRVLKAGSPRAGAHEAIRAGFDALPITRREALGRGALEMTRMLPRRVKASAAKPPPGVVPVLGTAAVPTKALPKPAPALKPLLPPAVKLAQGGIPGPPKLKPSVRPTPRAQPVANTAFAVGPPGRMAQPANDPNYYRPARPATPATLAAPAMSSGRSAPPAAPPLPSNLLAGGDPAPAPLTHPAAGRPEYRAAHGGAPTPALPQVRPHEDEKQWETMTNYAHPLAGGFVPRVAMDENTSLSPLEKFTPPTTAYGWSKEVKKWDEGNPSGWVNRMARAATGRKLPAHQLDVAWNKPIANSPYAPSMAGAMKHWDRATTAGSNVLQGLGGALAGGGGALLSNVGLAGSRALGSQYGTGGATDFFDEAYRRNMDLAQSGVQHVGDVTGINSMAHDLAGRYGQANAPPTYPLHGKFDRDVDEMARRGDTTGAMVARAGQGGLQLGSDIYGAKWLKGLKGMPGMGWLDRAKSMRQGLQTGERMSNVRSGLESLKRVDKNVALGRQLYTNTVPTDVASPRSPGRGAAPHSMSGMPGMPPPDQPVAGQAFNPAVGMPLGKAGQVKRAAPGQPLLGGLIGGDVPPGVWPPPQAWPARVPAAVPKPVPVPAAVPRPVPVPVPAAVPKPVPVPVAAKPSAPITRGPATGRRTADTTATSTRGGMMGGVVPRKAPPPVTAPPPKPTPAPVRYESSSAPTASRGMMGAVPARTEPPPSGPKPKPKPGPVIRAGGVPGGPKPSPTRGGMMGAVPATRESYSDAIQPGEYMRPGWLEAAEDAGRPWYRRQMFEGGPSLAGTGGYLRRGLEGIPGIFEAATRGGAGAMETVGGGIGEAGAYIAGHRQGEGGPADTFAELRRQGLRRMGNAGGAITQLGMAPANPAAPLGRDVNPPNPLRTEQAQDVADQRARGQYGSARFTQGTDIFNRGLSHTLGAVALANAPGVIAGGFPGAATAAVPAAAEAAGATSPITQAMRGAGGAIPGAAAKAAPAAEVAGVIPAATDVVGAAAPAGRSMLGRVAGGIGAAAKRHPFLATAGGVTAGGFAYPVVGDVYQAGKDQISGAASERATARAQARTPASKFTIGRLPGAMTLDDLATEFRGMETFVRDQTENTAVTGMTRADYPRALSQERLAIWPDAFARATEIDANEAQQTGRPPSTPEQIKQFVASQIGDPAVLQATINAAGPAAPGAAPGATPGAVPGAAPAGVAGTAGLAGLASGGIGGGGQPPITPEQARVRLPSIATDIELLSQRLDKSEITSATAATQLTAGLDDWIATRAKADGWDPVQTKAMATKFLADKQLTKEEWGLLAKGPLAEAAKDPGLWDQFMALPGPQKAALAIGIPLALFGIGQAMFGEGGMGSILMAILGLGGIAGGLGLFGGEGMLAGTGQSMGLNIFGGGGGGGQGAAPTFDPAAALATARASLPKGSPLLPLVADDKFTPEELQQITTKPELQKAMREGGTGIQDAFLQAQETANPTMAAQLPAARLAWGQGGDIKAFRAFAAKHGYPLDKVHDDDLKIMFNSYDRLHPRSGLGHMVAAFKGLFGGGGGAAPPGTAAPPAAVPVGGG